MAESSPESVDSNSRGSFLIDVSAVVAGAADVVTGRVGDVVGYLSESSSNPQQGTERGSDKMGEVADVDTWVHFGTNSDVEPDEGFRRTNRSHSEYQREIQELKQDFERCNKQKTEKASFISRLNRDVDRLKEDLVSKGNKISAMRQEARVGKLKLEAEISKLQHELSGGASSGNTEQRLRDHLREQSKTIFELRQTIEMTSTDSQSYGYLLQEAEEERGKLKEDFGSARKEIRILKETVESLEHELTSSKQETIKLSETRTKYELASGMEKEKARTYHLEKVVEAMKKRIAELEQAKNEDMDKIAMCTAEAQVYKADFLEERMDRAKAQGALEEMRKEKQGQHNSYREEVEIEFNKMKRESVQLMKDSAQVETKLRDELNSGKIFIGGLKEQTEKIASERDYWKHEVERRKASKNQKIKDYDRMREQHDRSLEATIDLSNQLDKAKKEKTEQQRALRKLEDKFRKFEKNRGKVHLQGSSLPLAGAERLYEEERDRNESLQFEIGDLKDDIQHQTSVIATLKYILSAEQQEISSLPTEVSTPTEHKTLGSPTTPEMCKSILDSVTLENEISSLREAMQSMTVLTPESGTLVQVLRSLESAAVGKELQQRNAQSHPFAEGLAEEVAGAISTEVLQQDLSKACSELHASNSKMVLLENEKSSLINELDETKQELHRMKIDFVEFGSRNLFLSKDNIRALSVIAQLKQRLNRAGDEKVTWESRTMEAEQKVGVMTEELTVCRESGHKTEEELNYTRAEIRSLELDVKHLLRDIARVESDNELLREHLQSLQDQPSPTYRAVKREEVTISSILDGGGWGTVSAGVFGRCKVAIKQPHKWIMHQTTLDRMKREASNMARMHHPNLVTFIGAVFDENEEDTLPMIIIEKMDANLRATYQKTLLTKDQILSIFKDVAYALHHLHEFREPIIHRDLSAPNVLLKSVPGNRYIAKVSDFGSANLAKHAATGGEGAIIYSAPESFPPPDDSHPRAKQTVKMDSFSYGVLLCEVINRKLPDPENRGKMVAAVSGKWGSMHKLVVWCIKHEARERPSMAEILHHISH